MKLTNSLIIGLFFLCYQPYKSILLSIHINYIFIVVFFKVIAYNKSKKTN
jgi:hypothetical protein